MISVIVPIYNSERWIHGCVNSIQCQSYSDIEIILVDDCSTDKSFSICELLEKEDDRIKLYKNPYNQGANLTRSNGVSIASGEYIMFVDSDDQLPPTCIEDLLQFSNVSDIVIGVKWDTNEDNKTLSADSWRKNCARGGYYMSPIAKLYKKTLFEKNTFDIPTEIKVCEDDVMNTRLAWKNVKPVTLFLKRKCYIYNKNDLSLTGKWKWTIEKFRNVYDAVRESIPETEVPSMLTDLLYRRIESLQVVYRNNLDYRTVKLVNDKEIAYMKGILADAETCSFKLPILIKLTCMLPKSPCILWLHKTQQQLIIIKEFIQRITKPLTSI